MEVMVVVPQCVCVGTRRFLWWLRSEIDGIPKSPLRKMQRHSLAIRLQGFYSSSSLICSTL